MAAYLDALIFWHHFLHPHLRPGQIKKNKREKLSYKSKALRYKELKMEFDPMKLKLHLIQK